MGEAGGALAGRRIAIAGGGIAGLAAAAALAGRGARVAVYEQAASLREFGAGLQVSPNGMAVMRALGLERAVLAAGCRAEAVELRDGLSGRPVLRLGLAGAPYVFLHRGALLGLLAEAARAAGAEVVTGRRIVLAPGPGDGLARARLTMAPGAEPGLSSAGIAAPDRDAPCPPGGDGAGPPGLAADLLLGADGIHSAVRAAVDGGAPARFTGQVAWRAVIPLEPGAAPVASVAMGPGRHLVSYPLGEGLRNIVAVEERAAWAEERWSQRDAPEHLRRAFAGFAPPVRAWLDRVEEVHLWGLFRHPVAARWHAGRAAILGDAAHPTLPFLAQGANMALEDAWTLADRLDRAPAEAALPAWQALREARVRRIVATAETNARHYHLRGPLKTAAHLALRLGGRIAPGAATRRFDWLYGHDVTR